MRHADGIFANTFEITKPRVETRGYNVGRADGTDSHPPQLTLQFHSKIQSSSAAKLFYRQLLCN